MLHGAWWFPSSWSGSGTFPAVFRPFHIWSGKKLHCIYWIQRGFLPAMNPRPCAPCTVLSGGELWQHLQTREHHCSRAARLHPAQYSKFVIMSKTMFSLWRQQREQGCLVVPGLSALGKEPGLLLFSRIKSKCWEKMMHSVNTAISSWGLLPSLSGWFARPVGWSPKNRACGHKPSFFPCL